MKTPEISSDKYSSISVIDDETVEMLKHHAGGDIEVLKDLFESFFPEAEEQIIEIQQASEKDNKDFFQKTAHGLSGISATIGANQLKVVTTDMENLAKAGEHCEAYKLVGFLMPFFKAFIEKANELTFE